MGDGRVAIRKNDDIQTAVHQALADLGGMGRFVKPGDRVVISPNYAVPIEPGDGAVTNPEVVLAVIQAALEAGAGQVAVAESAICGLNAGEIMDRLGLTERFRAAGAVVINLDSGEVEKTTIPVPRGKLIKKLKVFRPALDCDLLISIPVMKTHIYAGVSLGMKNLKGTLPDEQKKLFHRVGVDEKSDEDHELDRCIADMMTVHHPGLTVIDASVAQEGFKAGMGVAGSAVEMNLVLAGSDFVAVDAVAADLMGFDPFEINHIRYCVETGLGRADVAELELLGDDPGPLMRRFQPAVPGEIGDFSNITVIEGGSCSGCSFAVRWTLNAWPAEQIETWDQSVFWVGDELTPVEPLPGKQIMIGTCACRIGDDKSIKIKGCPPPFFYIKERLTEEIIS